jgi:hypothetical protein
VAHLCFARVILTIRVLKTIQVTLCKANRDVKAVVIDSKCLKQLLKIKVYEVASLNFVNSRDQAIGVFE